MSALDLLIDLQNIDIRIDEALQRRGNLERELGNAVAVEAARQAAEAADERRRELGTHMRELELEVNGLADKIKQVQERLYGGRVGNPKELAGLEQDAKMLGRRKLESEDRMLDWMAEIEGADANALVKRAALEQSEADWNHNLERASAALREIDTSGIVLAHARDQLRGQIRQEHLALYDDLRNTKKGRALAKIKGTACAACGFDLPSALVSRARIGADPTFCSNCGRILVS